jgi:hypothetical protein
MAYTRVTKTRDGRAAIRYAFEEQKKKEGMDRVLAASGSNVDPKFAMMQMKAVWDRFGKDDGKTVQMYRIIQSFGLDELDPSNPEDVEKANNIGREFAEEMYPGRQSLIVTQADGKGGKLHNHVLVNSVSFIDGKSLRDDTKEFYPIARKTNEIMRRHGMNPPELPDGKKENKRSHVERKLAAAGGYVWKDDLKERITAGMNSPLVTSEDEYVEHMRDEYGVGVRFRGSVEDDDGKKIKGMKGISYDFVDRNDGKRTAKGGTLGSRFQTGKLNACIAANILDNAHAEALEDEAARVADAELLIDNAHAEALEDEALRVAEVQRLADATAKKSQEKVSGGFDFDSILGGDLAKLSKRFKPSVAPVRKSNFVEPDLMREVREEREAKQAVAKMDELHGEALVVNDEVDANRSQEAAAAARADRKAEQEKQKKDAENARKAIEAQEEARHQEQLKRAQILRDEAKERIIQGVHYGQSSFYNTTDEELTEFMKNEPKLTGKMMNSITGRKPYTTDGIYRYTKNEIADRKRAVRQGVDHATVQVAQDDGPEL